MKTDKININWSAGLRRPVIQTVSEESKLTITFDLDAQRFNHWEEGDTATLTFNDVYAYRMHNVSSGFRYNLSQFNVGDFYELKNSESNDKFPADKVVVDESLNNKKLCHYMLFNKDEIFECLAKSFQIDFNDGVEEILEEKYPKGYLNHYIVMFASQFDKPSKDNYLIYTDLYIQMEGRNEFERLKAEIKNIQKNNDLPLYVKFANHYTLPDFGLKQLEEMISVIEKYS